MEGSCAKDFGKELGQIHEGIITLRGEGLTAEGWQKIANDKTLAKKIVDLAEGERQVWLDKILAQERACHIAFFGCGFNLDVFAETLKKYGESKIRFWQKLGLEPHFLPKVRMSQDAEHPGWKVKPEEWFFNQLASGKIMRNINGGLVVDKNTDMLEGITVLVDTRLKPAYDNGEQMYKNDNLLGDFIKNLRKAEKIADFKPRDSRFNVSADEWEKYIKPTLAGGLSFKKEQVRLERTIEANVIPQLYPYMPRKSDGDTNTSGWYEEYFEDRDLRLYGGYSGCGGLADVHWFSSDDHWGYRSFRPLAVL